jgi:hypothetical protein
VLEAGDGVSALEIFEAKHDAIDVVVADVGLPRPYSAEELIRRIGDVLPAR